MHVAANPKHHIILEMLQSSSNIMALVRSSPTCLQLLSDQDYQMAMDFLTYMGTSGNGAMIGIRLFQRNSGIRSGPDIARTLARGAKFTFMGRPFMYSVAALGNRGGNHAMAMMKMQFQQIMEQLCCKTVNDLEKHLIE